MHNEMLLTRREHETENSQVEIKEFNLDTQSAKISGESFMRKDSTQQKMVRNVGGRKVEELRGISFQIGLFLLLFIVVFILLG